MPRRGGLTRPKSRPKCDGEVYRSDVLASMVLGSVGGSDIDYADEKMQIFWQLDLPIAE